MTPSHPSIESYLPEIRFLDGKQEREARICTEDCAVADLSQNGRIIASRGVAFPLGKSLFEALEMTREENARLRSYLNLHRRFIMSVGEKPLLILADWLASLGLVLAIQPQGTPAAVTEALRALDRNDLSILTDPPPRCATAKDCRHAYTALSNIFFYVDRILYPSVPLRRLLPLTAAFAGCETDPTPTPNDKIESSKITDRTVAFLLCAMLSVRAALGHAQAEEFTPTLRITVESALPHGRQKSTSPLFLQSPCFRECRVLQSNGKSVLLLPQIGDLAVRAGQASLGYCICIEAPSTQLEIQL